MERCADLVSVFFGTYGGTLCRSAICSLYSSIFMVIRWADPVSVFSDTYRNILYQSDISGQDAQSASIPRMFFPVGWKRQPEEETGKTSKDGVYAGGDAVTGAATVILAMGAGKAGAKGIDEYLKNK